MHYHDGLLCGLCFSCSVAQDRQAAEYNSQASVRMAEARTISGRRESEHSSDVSARLVCMIQAWYDAGHST